MSATSFWEIAAFLERRRLQLVLEADAVRALCLQLGITEIPLDGELAILTTRLTRGTDPCDRFIVATALARGLPLLTADEKLLAMRHGPTVVDARRWAAPNARPDAPR